MLRLGGSITVIAIRGDIESRRLNGIYVNEEIANTAKQQYGGYTFMTPLV
jgi:hypothetical protein